MEQKQAAGKLSTQKVLSSAHDPGWNDPPKWAFSGVPSSSATPTKRVLNKRVAFPLGSTQTADKESAAQVLPKPINMPPLLQSSDLTTVPHSQLICSSDKETIVQKDDLAIDKNQALNDALENLQAVINEHITEKSRAEEIQKRLDVMKVAWVEHKLNSSVHQQILDLSKSLRARNIEQADEIHIKLMMQHASLCSSWIPGIRHIILGLKAKCQDVNPAQVQDPVPHLLPVAENM